MKLLEKELMKKLLIVTGICFAAELIVSIPVQKILLPSAAQLARYESTAGTLTARDLMIILRSLLFGDSQREVIGLLTRSASFLLLLFSGILLLIPYAAGVFIASHIAAARFDELQKERDREHREYEEKRNLMFSDFAHDLRTPIMTISGYAQALRDHMVKDPAMEAEYLDAIVRKSGRMSELINLLFDFAKLGSTDYHLTLERCNINELSLETAAALYTDFEGAGMELIVEIPETPFIAMADHVQVGRVLTNLMTNAIRHNPPGTKIAVLVKRLAGVEYLAVADSGTMISIDAEKLFDPFVKEDSSRSGSKGSGLGLSISKKIADLHGWELTLQQPYESYAKAFVLKIPEA